MPGGRITPDGRPAQAKGVGRDSKRHDLERPATPGLHDSDLQQGDVQALEQGQRVQPLKRTQPPAVPAQQSQPAAAQGEPGPVPEDRLGFLAKRIGGTYQPGDTGGGGRTLNDIRPWVPLLEELAASPGASGTLTAAVISQVSNFARSGSHYENPIIDMQDADTLLEAYLGDDDGDI